MGNKVIYGCADFAAGTIEFTGESCTGTAYCGEVDWDNHRVAVTIADCVDSDQNTTYYSRCWNTSTGKFEVLIPYDCCTRVWGYLAHPDITNGYYLFDEGCNKSESPICTDTCDINDVELVSSGGSVYWKGRFDANYYPRFYGLRKMNGVTGEVIWSIEEAEGAYHTWLVAHLWGERSMVVDVEDEVTYLYVMLRVDELDPDWRDDTILIKLRDDGDDYTIIWEKSWNDGVVPFDSIQHHDMTISPNNNLYYTHNHTTHDGDYDRYSISKVSGATGGVLKRYDVATLEEDIEVCGSLAELYPMKIEVLGDYLFFTWRHKTASQWDSIHKVNKSTGKIVAKICDTGAAWGLHFFYRFGRTQDNTKILTSGTSHHCDSYYYGYLFGEIDINLNFTGKIYDNLWVGAFGGWGWTWGIDRAGYIYVTIKRGYENETIVKLNPNYSAACQYMNIQFTCAPIVVVT